MKVAFVGNVDHGKSTLIGRLLSDTHQISRERAEKVQKYCENTKQKYEFAYLLDALEEEQTQGITIDTTEKRFQYGEASFLFVDTPGHFEFLKKMIGGASRVDVAVFLLDVNQEISTVFLRQNRVLDLLGIKDRLVLLNKMDLANWNEELYRKQQKRIYEILGDKEIKILPISAYMGENLSEPSTKMPWYTEQTFLQTLDFFYKNREKNTTTTRITIQDAYRWDDKRIFVGRVESGSIRVNDKIRFLPSGESSTIQSIESFDEEKSSAFSGDSIGFTLVDPIYLERGAVGFLEENPPHFVNEILVDIFWLKQKPLVKGDRLKVRNGTLCGMATVEKILYELDSTDLKESSLNQNIHIFGRILLKFESPWICDDFASIPELGRMVFFQDLQPVGGGIIVENLNHSPKLMDLAGNDFITKKVAWLTGLSGSGKTTLANHLANHLRITRKVKVLDGDEIRKGLCSDLGFSESDRKENVRRVAEVAKLFLEEGYFVIVALISPFESHRALAKSIIGNNFAEIFVDCPLSVCESRDVKGFYKKVRSGELSQFTGIQSSYEPPINPDLKLDTEKLTENESFEKILKFLKIKKNMLLFKEK